MLMKLNQRGFSHVLLVGTIGIIILAIAFIAANRIQNNSSMGYSWPGSSYKPKDFSINFARTSDENLTAIYDLSAYFSDSFDSKSGCPARLSNFVGRIAVSYQSQSKASVTLTQNVKPKNKNDNSEISAGACPAVAIAPYSSKVTLDKKWVENNIKNKTIRVNGHDYQLYVDKSNNLIRFTGLNAQPQTFIYLPDGLAQIYAYPMYKNCMSLSQLNQYAQSNKIVTADKKYPGLTSKIQSIPKVILEAPDGSRNVLLVIADENIKHLIAKTKNEKNTDVCHVVASPPLITGIY